jgi:oligopeptide transport system permease protein
MVLYLLKRLFWSIIVMMVVFLLAFSMTRCANPESIFENDRGLTDSEKQALFEQYGLNLSPIDQVFWVVERFLDGELYSFRYKDRTVNSIIADTFPVSFTLGLFALFLALTIGLTTGILAALKQNTLIDHSLMTLALLGISLPTFVTGSVFILFVIFNIPWLPLAGWGEFRHIISPALILSLPFAAFIARLTRVGIIEMLSQDFVITAKAKGLNQQMIVIKHVLKGGLLPVVSYLGPASASIFTGSFAIEKLFAIPGLGFFMVDAAQNRDADLVLGLTMVFSILLISFNFFVDIAYAFLDPRIRLGGKNN